MKLRFFLIVLVSACASRPLMAQTQQVMFDFVGHVQTWLVPNNVTSVLVDTRGAQGGGNPGNVPIVLGGKGGRAQTTLAVTPNETLFIYVGGKGGDPIGPNTAGPGGFNGGAAGGIDNVDFNGPAGGGGGASDVRQGGDDLTHRVVVAGGGGGAECCTDANGGAGGDTTGMFGATSGGGSNPGGGGTLFNGGDFGTGCNGNGGSGSLGQGGVGGNGNRAGGGGGGGYYGGGGGGGCLLGSGGGGGSSFSAGSDTTHTQGFQTGDGQIIVTFTPAPHASPSVTLVPQSLAFPGAPAIILTVQVTNSGTAPLNITAAPFITGAAAADFMLTSGTTCINGAVVAPSASCLISVTFSPSTQLTESASLSLTDDASDRPQIIPLSGGPPHISNITPDPVLGSDISQTLTPTGTNFMNGATITWQDLSHGGSGSVGTVFLTPSMITASLNVTSQTASWRIQAINPDGETSDWFSFQVLGANFTYKNDYPFRNSPFCSTATPAALCTTETDDPYGFFYRECTSFIAWRMNRDAGKIDPQHPSFFNLMGGGKWGNATNWSQNALALGYTVDVNPEVGAIAQWQTGECPGCAKGHVAYVEKINIDGSVDVSEYNFAGDDSRVDHEFGIRTPSVLPPRFIHIRPMTSLQAILRD